MMAWQNFLQNIKHHVAYSAINFLICQFLTELAALCLIFEHLFNWDLQYFCLERYSANKKIYQTNSVAYSAKKFVKSSFSDVTMFRNTGLPNTLRS